MYMYNCMMFFFFHVTSYDNYRSCVLEDNCVCKRAPIERKKSALIQKKEKGHVSLRTHRRFLFAQLWTCLIFRRQGFIHAERRFEPWEQDRAGSNSAALDPSTFFFFSFLFFPFRLVIDALMEDVPMTLHHVQMGLVTGSRWSGSDRSPPGIIIFWGAPARQVSR